MTARTLACLLGLLLPVLAHAARFEVPVQGSRELTLAVAEPIAPRGDPHKVTSTVRNLIEHDLELTGYFEIVPASAHIERGMGVEPGQFDFDPWRILRTAALVKLRVLPKGDTTCDPSGARMCLDVFVYDIGAEAKLAGKRFKGDPKDAIALAHEAAGAVLMALVGEPGFFRDVLAAVTERSGNKEIALLGIDGERTSPVTRNGSINLAPALSPDKARLAWISYRRGNADLYVKDLDSGTVRALSDLPGLEASPAFSPDGTLVALARGEGDTDLWLVDARTGRDIRQLTRGGGIDVSPHFSPDGRQIVFASERSGGSQIYQVAVTGGTPRRVTPMAGFYTDPVWSPDGSRIAFVSRTGRFDVLTIQPDGANVVRITQDMGDNEDPSWSSDGKYLVFTSTRDGKKRIWISTANGRHQMPLTSSGAWSQPVWTR